MSTPVKIVDASEVPASYDGQGFQVTTLDKAVGLARANSLWPLPFATSCCGIELWVQWVLIMIWPVLARSVLVFRHAKPIYY